MPPVQFAAQWSTAAIRAVCPAELREPAEVDALALDVLAGEVAPLAVHFRLEVLEERARRRVELEHHRPRVPLLVRLELRRVAVDVADPALVLREHVGVCGRRHPVRVHGRRERVQRAREDAAASGAGLAGERSQHLRLRREHERQRRVEHDHGAGTLAVDRDVDARVRLVEQVPADGASRVAAGQVLEKRAPLVARRDDPAVGREQGSRAPPA